MGTTPTVSRVCRLPPALYRRTVRYADRHEITWNDAIRLLAEQALEDEDNEEPTEGDTTWTNA